MSDKPSILYSIFTNKCPGCRKVSMFKGGILDFKELGNVYKICPNCGANLWVEIGFYWGALYVAYMLTIFTCFAQFLIYYFVFGIETWTAYAMMIVGQLLISHYLYRLSKSMWAHVFVRYHGEPKVDGKVVK